MYCCEVCGKSADIHHIVYKSEGGLDINLNYKYLCHNHHRGKDGPHRNNIINLKYKVEMQEKLSSILYKDYYTFNELIRVLNINTNCLKKLVKNIKLFKEGYKTDDIIFNIMGKKTYNSEMIEDCLLEKMLSNY
ncbi:HNH endonuclease [Clostridium manihotivorum]|uniref:HNH endonuclease n=1 Tax=Clostridium manihotivorum TaxID=2320868 RepID=A0A410DPH8_9CLOT|nr:HNH endonuclease [Clostridium manihotivorum]QAA30961.1 HNH endonuclease [Clostridium manihotivorum]